MSLVTLHRDRDRIILSVGTSHKTRVAMTEDEAQHLSNRLQSYAKGNSGFENVFETKK